MKIGFKPKSYNDVICFEFDNDMEDKSQVIAVMFNAISALSEEELDFVVTVKTNKGENKTD